MCPTQETAVSIWVRHQLVLLYARPIVGNAYVRKLNKRSLLNILPVHDNKLPYECSGSGAKCSVSSPVLVTLISGTLMRNWWPPIHQWVDRHLDDSSPELLEENVKKSDQSMNWLYVSWIFGDTTCFVIRRKHHPYVLSHTRRPGWGRPPAHSPRSVFNDRRREEPGRQMGKRKFGTNQTQVSLMPPGTTKMYRLEVSHLEPNLTSDYV